MSLVERELRSAISRQTVGKLDEIRACLQSFLFGLSRGLLISVPGASLSTPINRFVISLECYGSYFKINTIEVTRMLSRRLPFPIPFAQEGQEFEEESTICVTSRM
ncbi:putative membrane protein [Peribacillus deserti]|uniref:Membrane protein n=1 Tax=Peribacillus deserti TaxID=673318 RepID=A0ABS2QJD2_9BACI|nr:hypothetical protein [Peribacillus deserti]MBM7693275.1 putative membrane protein [Peribacillus deserti]